MGTGDGDGELKMLTWLWNLIVGNCCTHQWQNVKKQEIKQTLDGDFFGTKYVSVDECVKCKKNRVQVKKDYFFPF